MAEEMKLSRTMETAVNNLKEHGNFYRTRRGGPWIPRCEYDKPYYAQNRERKIDSKTAEALEKRKLVKISKSDYTQELKLINRGE